MRAMKLPAATVRNLLLIHWHGADAALDWLTVDGSGRLGRSAHEHAPPAAILAAAASIVVLVPSEPVTLLLAELPARTLAQARLAAPFAVEEHLAAAVDALHFAVAPMARGHWWVAALAPAQLKEWIDDLRGRGIEPDRLLPDVMALPANESGASVLVDGDRALIRIGEQQAFASDAELAPMLLAAAGIAETQVVHIVADSGQSPLSKLAAGLGECSELNLLSKAFAPHHRGRAVRGQWRRLGILAAACLLLAVVYLKLDELRLNQRLAALNGAMEQVYRQRFPDAKQVPNPLAQMRSALAAASGSGAISGTGLDLLTRTAPLLAAQTQVSLQSVEYRAGALVLDLKAPSIEAVDAIRESLASSTQLVTTLENVDQDGNGVRGRIRLERKA